MVFTQMSAKVPIKRFGGSSVVTMINEFWHIYKGVVPGKPVVEDIDPTMLTKEEIQHVMDAVNILK